MTTNSCLLEILLPNIRPFSETNRKPLYAKKKLFEYRYMCFVLIIGIGLIIGVYIINHQQDRNILSFYISAYQYQIWNIITSPTIYINSTVCIFPYICYLKISQILPTIEYGSAMAPTPLSLHINTFSIGGISWYPHDFKTCICWFVIGWSHIIVFIAGANKIGFVKSQARQIHVKRLSHKPLASFANVFASNGANKIEVYYALV